MSEYKLLIESTPFEVKLSEITDLEKLDERISAVGVLYSDTIGMCNGYVEFCPDNEPPLIEEKLSWIWAIRPDLSQEILNHEELSQDLKLLIESYQNDSMNKFWDFVNCN